MNAVLDVAAAVDSTDCDWPRLIPGSLSHLMHDDQAEPAAPPPQEETRVDTCKIDGCANESAGKKGSWHGLCQQHVSEEAARRGAARRGKTRSARATAAPVPAARRTKLEELVAPEGPGTGEPVGHPGPTGPAGTPEPEQERASLVELAQAVETAGAELTAARERHTHALNELRAALDAAA